MKARPERFVALDLFRGLTVVAMIFVNNPGDWSHIFPPFDHAEWNGLTPTDLVFPFFLFVAGVAGYFSLTRKERDGASRRELAWKIVARGAVIVLVGWSLAAFPYSLQKLSHLRIPGVLPRIGVVFILGSWIVLLARRRASPLFVAIALLLVLHTALLTLPGYDLTREGNIQRAVDLALLKGHLWKPDWDPEGIVSTLTAIATFLTGTLAGILLKSERSETAKATRFVLWGAGAIAAGLLMNPFLPLNKNLWTASYVLVTSGCAAILLILSTALLLGRETTPAPAAFFVTFGRNPLLAFVLSGLLARILGLIQIPSGEGVLSLQALLYRGGFSFISDPTIRSHAFALATVLLWYGVLKLFERRNWIWKI